MKTRFAHILCSFILIFASIRGVFIYHLGFPSNITYTISSLMVLGLGLFSLLSLLSSRLDVPLVLFKNAVILNVILFVYLIFGTLLIAVGAGVSDSSLLSLFYFFLVFPTVFVFLRFDDKLLTRIVYIITFITVIGVYYFFNLGISGGFDAIEAAHSTLRPDYFTYSRIGLNLLPFGYTGSHHDTANILVMCGIFFLGKFFLCSFGIKKFLLLACYFLILSALLLTGSAANTLVLLFTSTLSVFFYIQRSLTAMLISLVFFSFIGIIIAGMDFNKSLNLFYVLQKLNPNTIPDEIFASLDFDSILNSFVTVLLGFGGVLESPLINSEVGFVNMLSRFGLFSFAALMFIGFSPIYYLIVFNITSRRCIKFLKLKSLKGLVGDFEQRLRDQKFRLLMIAMPIITGTLTLIHYGSLFRITSIGLFCVLLTIFLKGYLRAQQFIKSESLLHS